MKKGNYRLTRDVGMRINAISAGTFSAGAPVKIIQTMDYPSKVLMIIDGEHIEWKSTCVIDYLEKVNA